MFKRNKKNWDKPFSEKVARRVSTISTGELLSWAEQALSEINRCISGYQRNHEEWFLEEAVIGAEALHAVLDEYARRTMVN